MKTIAKSRAQTITGSQDAQESLYRTLDHMIEGCQIISRDYRYVYVNQAVARQGHMAKGQLLGRTMMEAYPGIERTPMFKYLKRCMKGRRLQRMENEFKFPDGSKGWFELRMEPVPEGVLLFSEDITKRKNAEEALSVRNRKLEALTKRQERTKQDLLAALEDLRAAKDEISLEKITDQAILENIGEGLIAIDAKGRIMVANKTAERLLGNGASELKGRSITTLAMLDSDGVRIPAPQRPIFSVLNNGAMIGPSSGGYYFVHKYKGRFPVGITATPIRLEGRIIGAIEIFRDVSKEQEIDKAKTEFVSIASHQLRTPLGLTKWYLEAMQEEGVAGLSNIAKGYFDEVSKSNERVLKVVRELLSVSRIDQGRVKNEPKRVDIVRLVKDIVEEMAPAAAVKSIKLSLDVKAGHIPDIYLDNMRLHEVIQNLIANALEYTPPKGSVTIKIGRRGPGLVVRVADTGIGIAEEDRKRLFTKFFRSEQAALNNPDGSGLGLYVVKSYVEGWGGTVAVHSQEGKGSEFVITLPTEEAVK